MFKDKTVALVGNGPVNRRDGRIIDACNVVIRCNFYVTSKSRGNRVTHHALNPVTMISRRCRVTRCKKCLTIACVRSDRMSFVGGVKADIWLPQDWLEDFASRIKVRPTIGCMLTHWLLEECDPYYIVMAGFSWSSKGMHKCHNLEEEYVFFKAANTEHVVLL